MLGLVIFGTKPSYEFLGFLIGKCPSCQEKVPLEFFRLKKKFTLYFVPLFTYANKIVAECPNCKGTLSVPPSSSLLNDLAPTITEAKKRVM
jgi:hypothetical protein